LEIQVALNPAPHFVVEITTVSEPEHCLTFGINYRASNQTMFEQFLIGGRVPHRTIRAIAAQRGVIEVRCAMPVLRTKRVDQRQMARPFASELVDARQGCLGCDRARVNLLATLGSVAADPEKAGHQWQSESLTDKVYQNHAERNEQQHASTGRRERQRKRSSQCHHAARTRPQRARDHSA